MGVGPFSERTPGCRIETAALRAAATFSDSGHALPHWQPRFFDHLTRLVKSAEDWLYRGEIAGKRVCDHKVSWE